MGASQVIGGQAYAMGIGGEARDAGGVGGVASWGPAGGVGGAVRAGREGPITPSEGGGMAAVAAPGGGEGAARGRWRSMPGPDAGRRIDDPQVGPSGSRTYERVCRR